MKKLILLFLILFMPLNVMAYSDYIYRGGNTLGIEVQSDGVLIVGFYEINNSFNKGNPKLKVGDYIKKVNGIEVNSLKDLTREIEKNAKTGYVIITFLRNGEVKETKLELIEDLGVYKTGLFVKDGITGIGTLTYIDPKTGIYGALGHEIIEGNSNKIVEIKSGNIFKNEIISINKSSVGKAGSKNAKYYYNTVYGDIYKNTNHGIFGKYTANISDMELVKVAKSDEILIGKANIYTVLENNTVEEYEIEITKINDTSDTKNITFKIVDEELISKTGGVIQGMSGSPIMQKSKIIGVVTHVIVDNPLTGYGLFITTMLEEGEK